MKRWMIWASALLVVACNEKAKDEPSDDGSDGDGADGEHDAGGDGSKDGSAPAFACDELTSYYTDRCADHMEISDDVTACEAIANGRSEEPFVASRARAAAICAQAAESCDDLFMCLSDQHGISASAENARIVGSATVEGEEFTFDSRPAWVAITTRGDGTPGDLIALFHHEKRPWYFKLEELAARADEDPFVVDTERPIKLENWEDNVEISAGTVTVKSFAIEGAFEVRAMATDSATGERIDLKVSGKFPKAD